MTSKKWAVVGIGVACALSSCGSSHHAATAASTSTTAAPGASTTTATIAPGPTPTSAAPATTAVTAAPAPAPTAPAGPVRCPTASLAATLADPNGAAGSVYYTLGFRNTGSVPCVLQGYPGVSFVTGSGGTQVGASAARIAGSAPSVTLAPGASAGAVLQITEAANYGTACGITPTTGLRVYPPDMTAALYVAHPDNACANKSDVTLHVAAVQPGS